MTEWLRSGCLRRLAGHPTVGIRARVVCFPHAGGAASAFRPLAGALPASVEVVAVQYPGRLDRRADPPASSLSDLADEAVADLRPLSDQPVLLLGHSMGALVAFEAAVRLGRIDAMIASAARPPAPAWPEPNLDHWEDEAVVAGIRRLGGPAGRVLDDPDLRREAVRVVRADQRLIRVYHADPDSELCAPITALVGASDPKNSVEQVRGWAAHTAAASTVEILSGGHFAALERPRDTTRVIVDLLSARLV